MSESLVEMIDRVRAEREEAFKRASLFARHADRLEDTLRKIIGCPCCEQYSCAELASRELEEANDIFCSEWEKLKEINNADI